MELKPVFQAIAEQLQTSASVKTVYGEPISAHGKVIVPVAKVAYGFGGGSGKHTGEGGACPEGEGGGGGVAAKPVGVVEVSETCTRFIEFGGTRKLLFAAAAGALAGLMISGAFKRR